MKRVWIVICSMLLAIGLCAGGITAFTANAAEAGKFVTEDESITVSGTTTVTATGTADSEMVFTYNQSVDFSGELGASFRYAIAAATDTTISETARTDGSNYVDITVLNSAGKGVRMRYYALYTKISTQVHKADVDVFYVDPSIKAKGNDAVAGERYLETIEQYETVEDYYHTVDIHKEDGYWFFALDGLTAVPRADLKELDLSNCTVTFKMYSKTNVPKVKLYAVQSTDKYVSSSGNVQGKLNRYVVNGFMQFGSDVITYPGDDTVKLKIADKRAAQYPGMLIRYREHLVSTVGYDVRQPINIEYSYDVSNASAVWYAFGLGRPNVLSTIDVLKYNVYNNINETYTDDDGEKKTRPRPLDYAYKMYDDSIAAKNDGVMIQTTTGMAQPVYRDSFTDGHNNNRDLVGYLTHSKSKPYESREDIDLITFIVGETGTELYMNGDLLFENLSTKLSDFEASGYMAYPYFHFFEDNANTSKGNTIVIKGVNAPRRTDTDDLRVTGNSGKSVEVGLDDNDNGEIKLYEYVGEDKEFTEVSAEKYSYDATAKMLTLNYALFEGREWGVYKFYARNNSGSEEISVRLSDPTLVTLPPEFEQSEYYWKEKSGTEDLVIKVDIKNGNFVSFSGGGIVAANWTYTPGTDSTVGTITIKKEFLNNKKAGSFTFKVKTDNIEGDEFSAEMKVIINSTGTPSGGGNQGGGDGAGGSRGKSCGSEMSGSFALGGALLLLAAAGAIVLFRKQKGVKCAK